MVLLGGAFVRFQAFAEWERAIDEHQYVRLMAAAMWAMVPFTVLGITVGIALTMITGTQAALLFVVPGSIAVSFAVLARMVVRRLYRGELGDRLCDRCGYMLLGLQDPRCPECGQSFPAEWLATARSIETMSG
jgi:tRNA(Ile2) C34 agmatinyltransferase TiaS